MIRTPPPWPSNCKCAVSITFDIDADSLIHLEHPSDSYRVDCWLASIVEREDVWIMTMANIAEYIHLLHRQGKYEPRIDTLPFYSQAVTD